MGAYARAAKYYDLLYAHKDYASEADLVARTIRARFPDAVSILDVGCGTAAHAPHLIDAGFAVDGLDLEPEFIELARVKCPDGNFHIGDMRSFQLGRRYDAVVSLFSAIGYARDVDGLGATLRQMARHVKPGGVVVVDPWFEPGGLTHGWITTVCGGADGVGVCRVSRTLVDGTISRLEFEYLVGTSAGMEHFAEVHELGLFTQSQVEAAFDSAGLSVERLGEAPGTRGMYAGQSAEPPQT